MYQSWKAKLWTFRHNYLLLFLQCLHKKLPHLLNADVMHQLDAKTRPDNWHEWDGLLAHGITTIAKDFLGRLAAREIPDYAMMIAHIAMGKGGMGLMNPAQPAIPDFVLNMTSATRFITQGYRYNKDLPPLTLHSAVSDLFAPAMMNPASPILGCFMQMQSAIAAVAVAPTCPILDAVHTSQKNFRCTVQEQENGSRRNAAASPWTSCARRLPPDTSTTYISSQVF